SLLKAPDLISMTLKEARIFLENHKLSIGEEEFIYSDEFAKNVIVDQKPEPGEEIEMETEINLVISNGPTPDMLEVPNVLGLKLEEAINKLNENGFTLGEIDEKPSKRFLTGQVAEQEYQPGNTIPENSKIDLILSSGLINNEDNEIHSAKLNVYIPPGSRNQRLKIIVIDNNGEDILYEGSHQPDTYVPVYFNSVGSTKFEIYINNNLWEVYRLG
ncbi:MAG TPA: PASTA domain-containing protein, partial [Halanaerobiales bacterium]|nr:PASTA domain-containing protein [Halanaerobiales bacterium]